VVEELYGPELAQAFQLGIDYDPQPRHDTGAPEEAPAETVEAVNIAFGQGVSWVGPTN
jgi:hypothetical protein